ncbi:MAG: fused MFS/spermidine synthase [archaeon]
MSYRMGRAGSGWKLRLQVFICGLVVMALETSGSRLLAPHFGSTIFVWGSLIGVVLTAMALGYYLGGRMADRDPSYTTFCMVILTAGALVLSIPTISPPVFDFSVSLNIGERYGPLIPTITLLMLPSFLLGMISPYAIKLVAKGVTDIGNVSGNLYSLSTAGSIAGTFLTVFLLIPEMGVVRIFQLLGALLVLVSLLGLGDRIRALLLLVLIISTVFSPPFSVKPSLLVFKLAQNEVLLEKDTLYHHMVVLEGLDPLHMRRVRTMLLDDNFHSAMDIEDPNMIVYSYNYYFHAGFIFNPDITDVLFIGGGGFSGPKRFLADYPEVNVDVVEIDGDVIAASKRYFNVVNDPRLRIFNEDGRMHLVKSQKKYDLVILDAYSRTYVPFHLMTIEFFELITAHLKTNGVVVSNLISPLVGTASRLFMAEVNTVEKILGQTYVFRAGRAFSEPDMDYETTQNLALVATVSTRKLTKSELLQAAESNVRIRISNFRKCVETLVEYDTSSVAIVLTDDYAPVETLLNPLTGRPVEKSESIPVRMSFDPSSMAGPIALFILVAAVWLQHLSKSRTRRKTLAPQSGGHLAITMQHGAG